MKNLKITVVSFFFFTAITFAQAQNYDSNFFPIGVWSIKGDFRNVEDYLYEEVNGELTMPAGAPALHEELFSDLNANGFNAAFMSLDPIGPTLHSILNTAETHNIKIISSMQNLSTLIGDSNTNPPSGAEIRQAILNDSINYLKSAPSVLGYYLYDEPLPGWINFDKLAEAKDSLLALSGGNHPILSAWNDVQHMSYIDGFLNLDVLMADIYPFSDTTSSGNMSDYMPAYFSSYGDPNDPATIGPSTPTYSEYLEQIRQDHCNTTNRPFWIVFQSFGDAVQYDANDPNADWAFWRQVEPKEIRLQVWVALMHGAKGLWYFLYESEHPVLLGMLDISGQPTQRLAEASEINMEVNKISDILLKLDLVEDALISVDQGEIRLHDDLSENTNDKYAIITNTDYFNANDIQVSIQKSEIGYEVNSIVDQVTEANISFTETATTIDFVASLGRATGSLYHLSTQSPLPIEMVSFNAFTFKNKVKLKWITLSEKNNKGFIIERSSDGSNWEKLGFLQGKDDPLSEYTYSFIDPKPNQGINYYRLLQEDFDGYSEYSKIVQVFFQGTSLAFYPNPAVDDIHFITLGKPLNKVLIHNSLGQLIHQSRPNNNTLDISFLENGIYFILGQTDDMILFDRLVINR